MVIKKISEVLQVFEELSLELNPKQLVLFFKSPHPSLWLSP